jgi:ATP-binding protein involved in chromosome partitioning
VASGKGGVGKSTVAANLAVALSQQGLKVGLLDADVYGPSVPMLMGVRDHKPQQTDDHVIPVDAHGIKLMSMGFLVAEETAMIWRGPMVQSALMQMLRDVQWGPLDILVIDMPPGTGDTQLTIAQRVPLSGAVIVSTPQDIALLDAVKAVQMFQKLAVPILGIIENMSIFCCPHCGKTTPIFGHDGAKLRARELGVNVLGDIPLDAEIRKVSDEGRPVVLDPSQHAAGAFKSIAVNVVNELGKNAKSAPKIIFEA